MHAWQQRARIFAARAGCPLVTTVMDVAFRLQSSVAWPRIGDHRCSRLDVRRHEAQQRLCRAIRLGRHAAAAKSLRLQNLDCDAGQDLLAVGAPSRQPGFEPADVRFVHLDLAAQEFPIRTNQDRSQPVQHRPSRLVRADLQGALQTQGRDSVFAGGEVPAGSEPDRERRAGSVEDGSRRHRRAAATVRAHEPPVSQPPSTSVAAFRADEPGGPSQPLEVVQAVHVGLEPRLKLTQRTGVVNACARTLHRDSMRLAPVKWIAHCRVINRAEKLRQNDR